MGSGDSPHVVIPRQRGQSPCGHFPSASREDLSMGRESQRSCRKQQVRTRRQTDGHRTEGLRAMDPGICIPDLLFPLPTHKAELSRRRAGTRRV